MTRFLRLTAVLAVLLLATAQGVTAQTPLDEAVSTFEYTKNMHPIGFSARQVPATGTRSFNSDLAFWGKMAVQGTYSGFRLIDISEPSAPVEIINWEDCAGPNTTAGNQGDVIIWENLIIRSWNSPAGSAGSQCGGMPVAQGEEGIHVIDISNPTSPQVIGFQDLPCGSHTETLVPDLENNRLLIYSNSSANTIFGGTIPPDSPPTCRGFDIVEIPLDDPGNPEYVRFVPAGPPGEPLTSLHPCHDTAVILGDANLVACAGSSSSVAGTGVNVFSIDPADGASKDNPVWLYQKATGGVALGHSASFTWDGKVLVVGHESGGGSGARCVDRDQFDPPDLERTFFFLDARTGDSLGQKAIPREQTLTENCVTHNYNVVPTDKRYVMVSGNYQSGISVMDFTDPANAVEIAYADPAPLPHPTNPNGVLLGGDWSTYWYNGFIYESDITRGLIIWKLSDNAVAGAKKLPHLNPQTQLDTFPFKGTAFGKNK